MARDVPEEAGVAYKSSANGAMEDDMNGYCKAILVGLGLATSAALWSVPASAQYYRDGYYEGRRGYGQGYERGRRYGPSLQQQKQMIRNQRQAQRRGYAPGAGYGRGGYGGHNPYAGFTFRQGPYGNYAVPITPEAYGNN